MTQNYMFECALKFIGMLSNIKVLIDTVKFPDNNTELEVFALKKQSLHGEYASNLDKINPKKDRIDENNV